MVSPSLRAPGRPVDRDATSATAPAFAVTDNHDGTATITLHEIAAIGALNARLAQLGISQGGPSDRRLQRQGADTTGLLALEG